MNDSCATDEELELLGDPTDRDHTDIVQLECGACGGHAVMIKAIALANGGELWRCTECGGEELLD